MKTRRSPTPLWLLSGSRRWARTGPTAARLSWDVSQVASDSQPRFFWVEVATIPGWRAGDLDDDDILANQDWILMGQVDNCPNADIPGLCVQRPQEALSVCGADGGCAVEDSGFAETEGRVYRVRGRFGRENGAYSTIAKLAPGGGPLGRCRRTGRKT